MKAKMLPFATAVGSLRPGLPGDLRWPLLLREELVFVRFA